jgi:2,4-dienoyl-CoA reductase-like NADH-dependent reductase (Old Yellow Enzyme family)
MSLFAPLNLRSITFKNRIGVSPMCQYSAQDGFANDWHLVHLGSRAVGGAGLVMAEATAVSQEGRISPEDLGIWKDEHIPTLARISRFIKAHHSVPGIQLAHAGRKASVSAPWNGNRALSPQEGGWSPVLGPSAIAFDETSPTPEAMSLAQIQSIVRAFADAAQRALKAEFQVVEIHAAHGYLLHEFLSPLSNQRVDAYGGSFGNRTRIVREVVQAVRGAWPEELPLFIRISASDWVEGGWDLEQSIELARQLKPLGVDLVDCSSGALVPYAKIPVEPGYQVPFAKAIREEGNIPTAAVGMITEPQQANSIVTQGEADMVFLARELLRDPYWPLHAATVLEADCTWPQQYERAKPRKRQPAH